MGNGETDQTSLTSNGTSKSKWVRSKRKKLPWVYNPTPCGRGKSPRQGGGGGGETGWTEIPELVIAKRPQKQIGGENRMGEPTNTWKHKSPPIWERKKKGKPRTKTGGLSKGKCLRVNRNEISTKTM